MQVHTPLLDNNSVKQGSYDTVRTDFTPAYSGVYYIGFYGYGNSALLTGVDISIDDIVISRKGAVVTDVSASAIAGMSDGGELCADTGVALKVVVTNTGLLPAKNILVDLTYTGAATGARSGTIAGPILMGATDTLVFASADLSATGTYDFSINIYMGEDEVAGNDTLELSVSAVTPPAADSIIATETGDGAFSFAAANPQSATTYAWDFGDGDTSSAAAPSHTYDQSGSYTVTLVVSNACGSDTHTLTLEVTKEDQGILTQDGYRVSIYPNPARDRIVIANAGALPIRNVSVFNSIGSLVHTEAVTGSRMQIETGAWPAGIYLVRLQTAQGNITRKLEITR